MVKYFTGEIKGVKLSDIMAMPLSNLDSIKERHNAIGEVLDKGGVFVSEYFSEHLKTNVSVSDELSEDNAVCMLVSLWGTYLLSAKDIETERKVEYKFWKSYRDYRKSSEYKSQLLESQLKTGDGEQSNSVMDMFYDNSQRNDTLPKDFKVTAKDIKSNVFISELEKAIKYVSSDVGKKRALEDMRKAVSSVDDERDKATLQRAINNYDSYVKRYVSSMRQDQLLIKLAMDRPVDFEQSAGFDGETYDWDRVDINNRKAFTILLDNLHRRDMSSDGIGLVAYDLYDFLVNKANLSYGELVMIKLFGEGYTKSETARELNISNGSIQKMIIRVHEKSVKLGYSVV